MMFTDDYFLKNLKQYTVKNSSQELKFHCVYMSFMLGDYGDGFMKLKFQILDEGQSKKEIARQMNLNVQEFIKKKRTVLRDNKLHFPPICGINEVHKHTFKW